MACLGWHERARPAPENRKPDTDEVADRRRAVCVASGRSRGSSRRKSHGAWIKGSVVCLLFLAAAGVASAMFAPEAASFVGKLVTGDGSDIAERIRSRL
jgi:hypothetical protein